MRRERIPVVREAICCRSRSAPRCWAPAAAATLYRHASPARVAAQGRDGGGRCRSKRSTTTPSSARSAASARRSSASRRSNRATSACARCAASKRRRASSCGADHLGRDRRLQFHRADADRGARGPARGRRRRHGPRLSRSADVDLSSSTASIPRPAPIADDKGNVVVFKTCDRHVSGWSASRAISRSTWAPARASRPRRCAAPIVKKFAVPGTLTQALDDRPRDPRRARQTARRDRPADRRDGRASAVHRQSRPASGANCSGGFAVGEARHSRASIRLQAPDGAHRDPEREPGAVGRRAGEGNRARSHHEPASRNRRADHDRDPALRAEDSPPSACPRTN